MILHILDLGLGLARAEAALNCQPAVRMQPDIYTSSYCTSLHRISLRTLHEHMMEYSETQAAAVHQHTEQLWMQRELLLD